MYQQGDIVLVPFPFSDFSGFKNRPAVIISKNSINRKDVIVAQITSTARLDLFSFPLPNSTVTIPLPVVSEVRTNKLFTIEASLIVKKVSRLNYDSLEQLSNLIQLQFEV